MPDLTFELPHWLYWSGLLLFPLAAMFIVRRRIAAAGSAPISLAIAYMLWLCGGFVGLHRFYLRSRLGAGYVPLFVAILFANIKGRDALDALSKARNELMIAEFDVERFQEAVASGIEGAAEQLASAETALAAVNDNLASAFSKVEMWETASATLAITVALLLVIDALLLPRVFRNCLEREAPRPDRVETSELESKVRELETKASAKADPAKRVHTRLTDAVDAISGWTGEFICYWSLIAVFVYYYEVIARYVFNSPTNWAHESMFLMFGMQYLISGAYAFREESHVRVDVITQHLPARAQAALDVITSVFFFIFAGTLLVTGWIFLSDSVRVAEVSFTEWGIQYWPVKVSIVLGAVLIILQGLSRLVRDVLFLAEREA